MAFDEAGVGDAVESGFVVEFDQVGRPHIPHTGSQTTHELVHHIFQFAFVGNLAFDAFGNEFVSFAAATRPLVILG